jgi:hypothetical protein
MKNVAPPSELLEPIRLLAGGGTEYERRLLEAAAIDVMPPSTPERLGRVVSERAPSEWAATPQAHTNGSGAWTSAGARLAKLGAIGGLGGLAIGGWLLAGRSAPADVPMTAPKAVQVAPALLAEALAPSPLPAVSAAPVAVSSSTQPLHLAEPSRSGGEARARVSSRARPARGGLLDEVRLLDAARAALSTGKSAQARRALAAYHARFARGELALEADVLNADLLLFDGQPERASALAHELAARPGTGRYRQRLEQLVQRAEAARADRGSNRGVEHMGERRKKQ